MYKIEAIIRPHKLEPVREALQALDLIAFTVSDCRGAGKQVARSHTFRGSQYAHSLETRLRLEIVLVEAQLKDAVDAIQKAASTGEIGDGKIFVFEVADAVRIRTGEHGDTAVS
jgi:nitrogen regulatory protein P-II 1